MDFNYTNANYTEAMSHWFYTLNEEFPQKNVIF